MFWVKFRAGPPADRESGTTSIGVCRRAMRASSAFLPGRLVRRRAIFVNCVQSRRLPRIGDRARGFRLALVIEFPARFPLLFHPRHVDECRRLLPGYSPEVL